MSYLIFWVAFFGVLQIHLVKARPREDKDDCIFKDDRLTCRRHLPNIPYPNNVTVLEIFDIEWKALDLNSITNKFPNAQNISIYGTRVGKILPPPKENNIQVLELRNLQINNLTNKFLENLQGLDVLRLTENDLQYLSSNISFGEIKNIYLSGNKWNCSEDMSWILSKTIKVSAIKDINNMTCFDGDYVGKQIRPIAQFLHDIKTQCPETCICILPKVVQKSKNAPLDPMIEVDCSERGFTNLPEMIPRNTKILKLQGNDIDNLRQLRENKAYKTVTDLYLDNNKITNIDKLEGTHWLTHFRVFSLAGNRISSIPTYALDNALEQNPNMPHATRLTFSGNPWRCDCVFTPVFQELLRKYAPQIKDINDIRCSYVEGDENSLMPIIELSRSSVCRLPTEYSIEMLDLLNGILASLIVLVLGKLAYDYYYFKKTGRLPWIVTKMP